MFDKSLSFYLFFNPLNEASRTEISHLFKKKGFLDFLAGLTLAWLNGLTPYFFFPLKRRFLYLNTTFIIRNNGFYCWSTSSSCSLSCLWQYSWIWDGWFRRLFHGNSSNWPRERDTHLSISIFLAIPRFSGCYSASLFPILETCTHNHWGD